MHGICIYVYVRGDGHCRGHLVHGEALGQVLGGVQPRTCVTCAVCTRSVAVHSTTHTILSCVMHVHAMSICMPCARPCACACACPCPCALPLCIICATCMQVSKDLCRLSSELPGFDPEECELASEGDSSGGVDLKKLVKVRAWLWSGVCVACGAVCAHGMCMYVHGVRMAFAWHVLKVKPLAPSASCP
jgi:hypothetical protein